VSAVETFVKALERTPDSYENLDIEANLRVTIDDTALAVSGSGEQLHIGLPSLPAALSLIARRRATVRTLARTLALGGLTAEASVGDAVVAILGSEAEPSLLTRALSLGPIEFRGRGVLAALFHVR
jgi:hypothetical protein